MAGILALITARGGSKGVLRKNILRVGGRPLIGWTIMAARRAARLLGDKSGDWAIDRIMVSTDSQEIRDISIEQGAEAPFLRPAHVAQDDSSHIATVRHSLEWLDQNKKYRPEWVLLLQPTSPLRTAEDICEAVDLARTKRAPAVISVCETHAHPYLCRTMNADGGLREFMPCSVAYPRRQDLPAAYALNGSIYLTKRTALLEENKFEPLGTIGYVMPAERSLQIDSAWDMHLFDLIVRDHGQCEMPSNIGELKDTQSEWAEMPEAHRVSEK
jgi:CMP-N,N'-diacetyllegionaminic acid synthase